MAACLPRHLVDQGEKIPERARSNIKKKLPSMYHQFMQLANLDITEGAGWKLARRLTTRWVACASTATPRCRMFPASLPQGECAAGLHGANRLGGNSLSDLPLSSASAQANMPQKFAEGKSGGNDRTMPRWRKCQADESRRSVQRRCWAGSAGWWPYQVQHELQGMMQDLRRHRSQRGRNAAGSPKTLAGCGSVPIRSPSMATSRARYPGWHYRASIFRAFAHDFRGNHPFRHRPQGKPRRCHFREDFPDKSADAARINTVTWKWRWMVQMQGLRRGPIPPMPDGWKADR